jgi:hypothetical protein
MSNSNSNEQIDQEDAMKMLELHSAIHNYRSMGSLIFGVAFGAVMTYEWNTLLPRWQVYTASGVLIIVALIIGIGVPRVMLHQMRPSNHE